MLSAESSLPSSALSTQGRPLGTALSTRVSIEIALYGVLLTLAAITRFWDLGTRALHHDESLHAYYSWLYATGSGYFHDPLMHGPFLFHANALVYLLFGDSDASSRYMPALFGVILVGLPYLLRGPRHLGRWGALAASTFFLISPSMLYYSRYIRHDLYTVVGALLLFTCIVRYLEEPERRWLVIGGATIGFMLTNHEIVFAIVAIFALFLWGTLLWGRLRPLLPLQVGIVLVAGAVILGIPRLFDTPLPEIPWGKPGRPDLAPTRENQREFYADLIRHPLVISLLVLAVLFLVLLRYELARLRDPARIGEGWMASLFGGAPDGSVENRVFLAWQDRTGLLVGVGLAATIFVSLFTTLFTNLGGFATGTVATDGTLLYWLGQQEERRGDQPWFYFLVYMPQYEFIAFLIGGIAAVVTLWRVVRRRDGETARRQVGPALFFRLFLTVWFLLIFCGLSYAGEKMPWLLTHITLPGLLLAATLFSDLIALASSPVRRLAVLPSRRLAVLPQPALVAALLVTGAAWLLLAGRLTVGAFEQIPETESWRRVVTANAQDRWWLLTLPPLAGLGLLAASWVSQGARRTGEAVVVATVIGLAFLQVHTAWRLSYLEGDVPRDTLIYNTTTPDVTRMMDELGTLSAELTGGRDLEIWYNGCVDWPLRWYLRDYPNQRPFGTSLAGSAGNAPVVIAAENNECPSLAADLPGYTAQTYVLRWHEPEYEIYRNFAIAPELGPGYSAWKSPADPHGPIAIIGSILDSFSTQFSMTGQQRLYRLTMYREVPNEFITYDFTVYIRNDLLPLLNDIRY